MALTGIGYDGTVDELGFAQLMGLAGHRHMVRDRASFAATQVTGQRQISLAPGQAYAPGVRVTNDAAIVVTFASPAANAGQWHLVVLRRNWDSNTQTIETLTDATYTTTATSPLAPPSTYPSAMNTNPGTRDDQPLYWAWVNASNVTVLLVDLREVPGPARGTTAQRNAFYGTINTSNTPGRYQLQGREWYNTEFAVAERYIGDWDATVNPNGMRGGNNQFGVPTNALTVAGWWGSGTNGTPQAVEASNYGDSLYIENGKAAITDTITFTLRSPRLVEVHHVMTLVASVNAACWIDPYINGQKAQNVLPFRWHNAGVSGAYSITMPNYRAWMPAGTHKIDLQVSPDPAGGGFTKTMAKSIVRLV
jgi:hypothetical protein